MNEESVEGRGSWELKPETRNFELLRVARFQVSDLIGKMNGGSVNGECKHFDTA
jgi:hypothetical protein